MEQVRQRGKAGRPKKDDPLCEQLAVMCTKAERSVITEKAKMSGRNVSTYLRELGLSGQVVIKMQRIPADVLRLKGLLGNVGGLLNQIAAKKNKEEPFNAMERAEARETIAQVKTLISQIGKFFE